MIRFTEVVIISSALVILESNAARILCVYPTPSFSHQIVYRSLTEGLAKRGHHLVVITTHPYWAPGESPTNVTEIDVYDVSHKIWQDGIAKVYHATGDHLNIARIYFNMFTDIFEKQIQSKPVQNLIKNKNESFDLLLLESNVLSALGLLNVFKVPVIQTSTFGPMLLTYVTFGAPTQPLLYPTSIHERVYDLSPWDVISNMYKTALYIYAAFCHEDREIAMLQTNLGPDTLPPSKLYDRVNVYFQTVYPIWLNNPPLPPGIVYLGGLHQKPANTLPRELQTFLDSFKNGVIYVSFGSNIHPSVLSKEKIDMMGRVFSKLPYGILWKKDQNVESETASNIRISTWFPQFDVLNHPKIVLFISQGGLQSTEEAITAGVPLIGVPIFGDQWMNTENYVRLGIGLQITWDMLSEQELTRSIARVVGDKRYKENVVRLRSLMNDQPQTPLERAIWWTEYLLKHGSTQQLRPESANMSWLQYYEVELVVTVIIIVTFIITILCYVIGRSLSYVSRKMSFKRRSKTI